MARFYPPAPHADAPSSERTVRSALTKLDDSWRVFHSVRWQAPRNGRQGDGEADFVLLHPSHGAVVLEVKGGRVEAVNGQWFTTDRHNTRHSIKDPFQQATASKHALLLYLRGLKPSLSTVPRLCHAVVFPDGGVFDHIGMHHRSVIWDSEDLLQVTTALPKLLAHWEQTSSCSLSKPDIEAITSTLAPTIVIERRLRGSISSAEEQLITLTSQQSRTLQALRSVRRCIVRGGAGTGKSLLAVEKARHLAASGARVLLTCYNAPLAQKLSSELRDEDSILVSSFHGLCIKKAKQRGMILPTTPTEEWWDKEAAEVLATCAQSPDDADFDALVIDEAQDFSDDWLTALLMHVRDPEDSPVFLFTDSHQELYRRGGLVPKGWPIFELDLNCRNTLQIAKTVACIFADPEPTDGASGPAPQFRDCEESSAITMVQSLVDGLLIDEGLQPSQVCVLSDSRPYVDRLQELVAGNASFTQLGGSGVVAETIHRFKGLESQVIILLLSRQMIEPHAAVKPILYVGTSRARSMLFVVAPKPLKKRLALL